MDIARARRLFLPTAIFFVASFWGLAWGAEPQWIWAASQDGTANGQESVWFRRTFRTPPFNWNARLTVSADDRADVFLNGKFVASCTAWDQPVRAEVSMRLNQGENVLAVRARNEQGKPGLLLHLNLGGAESAQVVSDTQWLTTTREESGWNTLEFDASRWTPATVIGAHGIQPWGDILSRASATPAESLRLLPGFQAELLRSAAPGEGSWVCMTADDQGRLYISPEGDSAPLLRITLASNGPITRIETVPAPVRFAMGLLFAHGSLYANARGPAGAGLYKLTDSNHNDVFDTNELHLLKEFKGGGEHGYHALALGPDDRIYVLNGNGTRLAEGISPHSPYRHWGEDVLSLNPDETTRPGGSRVPGCYILRTDADGREWELFAGGMRNAYGFDFSPDGELFAFDSDNEWDWGTPWYRPIRVFHCISGAEAGWRDGTRAWPDHYPDMLTGVVDVGIGSPCGVKFGTRARFPEKYRRALYVQDWSYGRILAVHLEEFGATYRGSVEEFVRGQPLNLTSMAIGADGAMYFITGGRATQSGLYRISHTNKLESAETTSSVTTSRGREARQIRHDLERFHTGGGNPAAITAAWPYLGESDHAIRHAARVALEAQDFASWQERARHEANAMVGLNALLALTRVAPASLQEELLEAFARFPLEHLSTELRMLKLRGLQLCLIRQGKPQPRARQRLISELGPLYPAATWTENRELSRLLIFLEAPVVESTLDLIDRAQTQEEQIHYVAQLRVLRVGWTDEDRVRYFGWWQKPRDHLQHAGGLLHWFQDVGREYVDGASLNVHLEGFRRDAIAALTHGQRASLGEVLSAPIAGAINIPRRTREFVQEWTLADLLPHLDRAGYGRNFERGRQAFIDAQCYACHRLGNTGGASGPELTGAAIKYGRRELLESIVEPSKVISDQYRNTLVILKDGEDATGRLVRESADELVIELDPLTRQERTIARKLVEEVRPSDVSAMPEGLLNALSREDILDLLAFLENGGRKESPSFAPVASKNAQSPGQKSRQ